MDEVDTESRDLKIAFAAKAGETYKVIVHKLIFERTFCISPGVPLMPRQAQAKR